MLRVAMIGTGGVVFAKHKEAYHELKEKITPYVICDPMEENRKKAGELFGVPPKRQIADPCELERFRNEVDFAVIATPVSFHSPCVAIVASLGWHVLCEKPLGMTVEEIDDMITHTRKANVNFGVIHNLYYMNITGDCFQAIRNGMIGEVRMVRCESHSDAWKPGEWRARKEIAGYGHFFDCLYHELYLTRAAVGSPVKRVYAQVANLTCNDITVEDTVLCLLEFENGAMASLQDCKAFRGRGVSVFETHGTKGSIVRNIPVASDRKWLHSGAGKDVVPSAVGMSSGGVIGVFSAYIDAIERGVSLPDEISAEKDGRENLRVLLAAYKSGELKQPVRLD